MAADLVPAYYVTGTFASIGIVLGGARSYYARQKKRWTEEGAGAARMAEAIEHNTKAAERNTASLDVIGRQLGEFIAETVRRFEKHESRLDRLEDLALPRRRVRGDPDDLLGGLCLMT
jgi:hypothetical protein